MRITLAVGVAFALLGGEVAAQYVRLDPALSIQADGPFFSAAVQPDRKILVGGFFTNVNGFWRRKVARLNIDGSVDEAFISTADSSDYVGEILVTASNVYAGRWRYDLNGNPEATYPAGVQYTIDSQRRQTWGAVTEWNAWTRLVRYNEDGSQDSTFKPLIDGCCLNRGVNGIAIQEDAGHEKIVIAGKFGDVNGHEYHGLARLNADGSTDISFVGYAMDSPVKSLVMWEDRKFYTATEYTIVRRHLPDGTLDPDFTPFHLGGPMSVSIYGIAPDERGRVVVFGDDYFNPRRPMIRRYNTDGTQDTNFTVVVDSYVRGVAHEPGGGILLAGEFTEVNCIPRQYLARLIPDAAPDSLPCVPPPPPPPKPEPELTLTRLRPAKMVCCWPTNYPEYTLQATRRLRPNHPEKEKWLAVTNTPVVGESTVCVTNKIARYGRHYRLVKP